MMIVEFSRLNTWYEIDDISEGRFLERTLPGSFRDTLARNGKRMKVLFNHGRDNTMGGQILGVPIVAEERATSPVIEVPLFDGVPELIRAGLRAGAYGSSFMFEVVSDDWDYDPGRSDHNPEGIPERSIHKMNVMEAGPVTWPANPEATAGIRSRIPPNIDALRRSRRLADLKARAGT